MKRYFFVRCCLSVAGFIFLSSFLCTAQKEHNVWYFGVNAGVDFNSGAIVPITGGQISTNEGSASICNASGRLLFYSDGIRVWDSTHAVMPNGTGLLGGWSSTQSAMIVKQPGSSNLYYLFTAPEFNNTNPVTYSIVDMTLNGGKGDLSVKSIALVKPAVEKLTYSRHANGVDYWIICHQYKTNSFYAYLLSSSGLNTTPVISPAGINPKTELNKIGYLKPSPCGNILASASYDSDTLEIFDFDQATGVVSNSYPIGVINGPYGVEFSPKGNFLYCSSNGNDSVFQFNMKAGSPAAIAASKTFVAHASYSLGGGMQLAPDGMIYMACARMTLDRIYYPDSAGPACLYQNNAISIAPGKCNWGLPNYVADEYCYTSAKPVAQFVSSDTVFCNESGACIDFFDHSTNNPTSWKWYFPGATPDSSTDQNPTSICYYTPGTYSVTLIVSNSSGIDSIKISPMITFAGGATAPIITQNGDTLCSSPARSYQWYFNGSVIPGATNQCYVATNDGCYAVFITDSNECSRLSQNCIPIYVENDLNSWLIVIYPNPVRESLVISHWPLVAGQLRIFNMVGEMVVQSEITPISSGSKPTKASLAEGGSEIDVHGLAKGIYLVEVSGNEKVFRGKFVKE